MTQASEDGRAGVPAAPDSGAAAMPQSVAVRRGGISIVWLIPLVALVIGAWLAYKTYSEQGPSIEIRFQTASGLQAGKTKVKFKDVSVGEVTAIDLGTDLKTVIVTAELNASARPYLTKNTRFWVERPRVTASRVSGLETLLSGAYIALDPVTDGPAERSFVGLEEPPLFTTSEAGKRFRLRSATLGSLNVGSPVYYRQIQVGQVVGNRLDEDGQAVTVEIFVSAPYDRLVYTDTRFWNASGFDFSLTAEGIRVDTQSLLSVVLGGIGFDTPETIGGEQAPAKDLDVFPLYPSREKADEKVYLRKEHYVMLFEGSVRGLNVDAPVLLRGIKVGKVLDVQLSFDLDRMRFQIPVLVELEPERVAITGDLGKLEGVDRMARLVGAGLRGQLKSGSLITGALYVDLDFHKDAPSEPIGEYGGFQVLPTVPAPLEALTTRASDTLELLTGILQKVDAVPIDEIGTDAAETVAAAKALVVSDALKGAFAEAEAALKSVSEIADRLNTEVTPELAQTLTQTTETLKGAQALISDRSPVFIEMHRMFQELAAAARSVRVITDYLERHPEALIRGKGNP